MNAPPDHHDVDSSTLRWIPTELLICIVERIHSDYDLLAVSTTSRLFHNIAIGEYFSRCKFDPSSREIDISSIDNSVKVLRGLSISLNLLGSSIDKLTYDCGFTRDNEVLEEEIRLLIRSVSKWRSVKAVSLRFGTRDVGETKPLIIALLGTILERSCRDLGVATFPVSSAFDEPRNMPQPSTPIGWLNNYWPANYPKPSNNPTGLNECVIDTFPLFLRPFYFHTLSRNSSSLTDLTFKRIFGGGTDWAKMLSELHFPKLRRLTVVYGVIPRSPFIKFLLRHPGTLVAFEYHHIRYETPPKGPISSGIPSVFSSCLQTLTLSPEYMVSLMGPAFATLREIRSIEIKIELSHNTHIAIPALEKALGVLAGCIRPIALTLAVTHPGLGLAIWLMGVYPQITGTRAPARPEKNLACVETLVLDNGSWGFEDDMRTYLPPWVALFPNLRSLVLRGGRLLGKSIVLGLGDEDKIIQRRLVEALKEVYPPLHVEFQSDRH